jgi:arylsulfatase A-like enzyme
MKSQVDWKGREVTGYTGWIFESEDGKPRPELGVGLTPGISETIADAACRYIRGRADKPYFLHVSFTAPHDPLLFPPGFEKMYDPAKMPLPVNFLPEHPFDHGNSRGRDELLMTFPRTAGEVREELACYYAVISHLDRQVGRVLDTLRETGQDRDTIVIYTADNGLAIGSHGLRGKQNMYEHSVNVPLIVRGPGIARGLRTDAQVYLRDLFPATCDAAGIPVPETVSGKSILPVLTKRAKSIRDEVYCYFGDVQRMIRTDRWKFAWYPHIGREQLFDMRTDPHELRDRIADASVASTAADLRTRLKAWLRREGDPVITA